MWRCCFLALLLIELKDYIRSVQIVRKYYAIHHPFSIENNPEREVKLGFSQFALADVQSCIVICNI